MAVKSSVGGGFGLRMTVWAPGLLVLKCPIRSHSTYGRVTSRAIASSALLIARFVHRF